MKICCRCLAPWWTARSPRTGQGTGASCLVSTCHSTLTSGEMPPIATHHAVKYYHKYPWSTPAPHRAITCPQCCSNTAAFTLRNATLAHACCESMRGTTLPTGSPPVPCVLTCSKTQSISLYTRTTSGPQSTYCRGASCSVGWNEVDCSLFGFNLCRCSSAESPVVATAFLQWLV